MGGMRRVIGLAVIGILVAACGSTHESPNAPGDKLYEAVGQSILVIDSRSHAVDRRLPLGTPSPDWKHLYSLVGDSLIDTNPLSGETQDSMRLSGAYQLPMATHLGLPGGLSPSGRWLVVQVTDPAATHMVVIDTRTLRVTDRFDLSGRFSFDAISDDGQRLYLIQNLDGKEYYVRLYNVNSNLLDANIVVDKSDGNQAMAGLRLSGVAAPGGSMLFSMYVRDHDAPFIHALNLSASFAVCLDLTGPGYKQDKAAMQWVLAMNKDGSRLYAVNGASGTIAEVDSRQLRVIRTAHFNTGAPGAGTAGTAVLSPDGKTLVTASGAGLVWVDTTTLRVSMQALTAWRVWSISLAADGHTLYAVNDAGQVAGVSMASGEVLSRFDPSTGRPIALMRVASS